MGVMLLIVVENKLQPKMYTTEKNQHWASGAFVVVIRYKSTNLKSLFTKDGIDTEGFLPLFYYMLFDLWGQVPSIVKSFAV